ncbi:hypothetical protein [Rhodococcus sp. WMMA185]|nr:hypothetical protein [Rhodococcus sp. WMMA185]
MKLDTSTFGKRRSSRNTPLVVVTFRRSRKPDRSSQNPGVQLCD